VRGGGRTGKIVDPVHLELERIDDVVPDYLEARIGSQVLDVGFPAGEEIIKADDLVTLVDQAFAQMRTQESGSAGNKYSHWMILGKKGRLRKPDLNQSALDDP
jgi:hypothetical protein